MNKQLSLKNMMVHHVSHSIINNKTLESVSTSFSGFLTYLDLISKANILCGGKKPSEQCWKKYRIFINICSYAIYYNHVQKLLRKL